MLDVYDRIIIASEEANIARGLSPFVIRTAAFKAFKCHGDRLLLWFVMYPVDEPPENVIYELEQLAQGVSRAI